MRPSQRETPSPSSPGQGSSQDFDGFPDGASLWGPASLLDAPAWPLTLEKGLWQPQGGEDDSGGAGGARGPPPTPPACPDLVPQRPCSAVGIRLSLTPLPGGSCWGAALSAGLQLGPWLPLTHCPSLRVLTPHRALLAPAAPATAVEGTPPEASVPLPCSGSHNLCLSCTAEIRADACQPSRSCVWGPQAPSAQARPGAVCALCALVFPGLGAGSGLRAPCAPGRQVWLAHGHVSSRGPGGIWTCLLLGALPFTTWPGYLPESVGMGRDRAVQRGGRPADCGLLGDSGPGRAPDPAAVRPQAAVIPLGWDPAPPTSHVTWRRSRARPVSPGLLAPSLPCCTCAGVLTVTPRRRAKGAQARTAG